jgi:eukaryotic-like serine/threonine-protein kinase
VVMEFVDGVPIDEFCDRQQLSVRQRLELFRVVCAAVQYAHQNLIVHRDLKPANILVTKDGQPKLLDFGIAKVRDPHPLPERERFATLLPIMTPDFASPEQVRGTSITTASDVYSLGVILYLILTGQRPYGTSQHTPHEIMKAVCETAPLKPSGAVVTAAAATAKAEEAAAQAPAGEPQDRGRERLRRALRGDVDSIVLKALRKDPRERYATAEQLDEDIRRHLAGLPVMARRGSAGYYVKKFISRHAAAVAGATAIVVVLVGAVFVSLRESHLARLQESRAERRFNDVRKLANTLIFDIHDSISNLPGAGPSRHLLINTALQYLGILSHDAGGDLPLQHELAAAYQRLGDIQGDFTASENDNAGALNSYRHALELLQAGIAQDPSNKDIRKGLFGTHYRLSELAWTLGDGSAALAYAAQALDDARWLAAADPASSASQYIALVARGDYNNKLFRIRGDVKPGLEQVTSDAVRMQALLGADPKEPRLLRTLSVLYAKLSELQLYEHKYDDALTAAEDSRRVLKPLMVAAPENNDLRVQEAAAEHNAAAALMGMGRLSEAEDMEKSALTIARSLLASDPKIAQYRGFIGMGLTRLADIDLRRGQPEPAIDLLNEGIADSDAALKAGTMHPYIRHENAQAAALMGSALAMRAGESQRTRAQRLQDWRDARQWYLRARTSFEGLSSSWFESIGEAQEASQRLARCEQEIASIGPEHVSG